MSPARLLEHFDRLIDTPDAVPRLRRFILDLAVRGKLVEQDLEDESAGELLKRIETEKARLVKAGEIRKGKLLPPIDEDTTPFDLPAQWEWAPLRTISTDRGQKIPDKEFTYIDVSAIDKERGEIADPQVLTPDVAPSRARKIVKKGDVIYSCVRPYLLNIAVVEKVFNPEPIASTAFAVLDGLGLVHPRYLWLVLRSPFFVECVEGKMRGQAYPAINDFDFAPLPVPIPPLAEQHRIVAKVDELMALCDELEAAQTKREKRRDHLVAATLHGLNNGDATPTPGTPSTFEESARFYFNHLPRLTTHPEHIHQLRQTILNLAVRGKLVPQDPNNEPADELLSRIEMLRTKLLTEGYPNENEANNQLRKQRSQVLPAGLASLPPGWRWATLMQCSALIVDCHNKTAPYSSNGTILLRTTNVRDGKLNLSQPKFVDEQTYTRWSARYRPEPGDILITREAPMGEVCIIPAGMKVCLGQRMMLAKLLPGTIDQKFMLYSLRDPQLMDRVQDKPVGATVQHLQVGGVETLLVALPPLAEQRRIVAKVDELMALCDKLETGLSCNASTQEQFLGAALNEALAARA